LFLRSTFVIRRLLALWVVVSLLGYSSAWAMDLHQSLSNDDESGHSSMLAAASGADQPTEHDSASNCDHCCHGLSHLIGLSGSTAGAVMAAQASTILPPSVAFRSHTRAPDLRPPIV